jgi:transposase
VRGGSPEPPRELPVAGAVMRHSCEAGQETRRANRNLVLCFRISVAYIRLIGYTPPQEVKPMRVACPIVLTDEERRTLERWSRGRSTPARQVLRAKIVLLAADGMKNKDIAPQVETDRLTVARWRSRFAQKRLAGIAKDAHRSGRKPIRRNRVARLIVERTTQTRPANATHWTTRTLAEELGVSPSMVLRVCPTMPWCCAPTRKARSRHWTAPSPACRYTPAGAGR